MQPSVVNRFNLLDWSAEEALLPQTETHNVGVTMGGVFYQGFLSLPLELVLQRVKMGSYGLGIGTEARRESVLNRLEKVREFAGDDLAALPTFGGAVCLIRTTYQRRSYRNEESG